MNPLICGRKINTNLGLLIMRLTLGIGLAYGHGYGKLINSAGWADIGNMAPFAKHIPLPAVVFGFMAMFAEFFGGILIALGIFNRVASALVFFTMMTAVHFHYTIGKGGELALVYAGMALALLLTGSGSYSLSKKA